MAATLVARLRMESICERKRRRSMCIVRRPVEAAGDQVLVERVDEAHAAGVHDAVHAEQVPAGLGTLRRLHDAGRGRCGGRGRAGRRDHGRRAGGRGGDGARRGDLVRLDQRQFLRLCRWLLQDLAAVLRRLLLRRLRFLLWRFWGLLHLQGRRGSCRSRGLLLQWEVGDGVDAHPEELLPDVGVPVVLDLVVRPPRQPRRDLGPPADAVAVDQENRAPAAHGETRGCAQASKQTNLCKGKT
jgi:hypothetical protein